MLNLSITKQTSFPSHLNDLQQVGGIIQVSTNKTDRHDITETLLKAL
jgi:hypothetical protein